MAVPSLKVLNLADDWVIAKNVSVRDDVGNWIQAKSVKALDDALNWIVVWVPLNMITVTGPTTSLSSESGNQGAIGPTLAPSVFTITLSHPEAAAVVVLQTSADAGASWAEVTSWTAPVTETLTHAHVLSTAGDWLLRASVTHLDGRMSYSNLHALTCYTKILTSLTSDPVPNVFERFTLTADCGAACLPAPVSVRWMYRLLPAGQPAGPWTPYGLSADPPANPQQVYQELLEPYEWTMEETHVEGSVIYSSSLLITASAILHFHEIVPSGGAAQIQTAMDRASRWFTLYRPDPATETPVNFDVEVTMACVELVAGVTYDLVADELFYRKGVRLDGNGAMITGHGTHIFKGDNNGGGGWNSPNRDWQIINTHLECENNCGGISTAHVFRYRLDGVTITNIGGEKHQLEINSSGGPVGLDFNVEILNCTFRQDWKSSGVRKEDEAIQLDYSWDGAAPNVASDGTVTNNVAIRGCTFEQLPRAIGGHVYNSHAPDAVGLHTHILIEQNIFNTINPIIWGDGTANSPNSEGAVRVYYWSDVTIQDNEFNVCYQPVMVYSPDDSAGAAYSMTITRILRNIFRNSGGANGRHAAYGGSGGGKSIGQVLFEDNQLLGTWGGGPDGYFAGFDDTSGLLPNSAYGVVIRGNHFAPDGYDATQEKAYNKYRAENTSNVTGVYIAENTISDGSTDNS